MPCFQLIFQSYHWSLLVDPGWQSRWAAGPSFGLLVYLRAMHGSLAWLPRHLHCKKYHQKQVSGRRQPSWCRVVSLTLPTFFHTPAVAPPFPNNRPSKPVQIVTSQVFLPVFALARPFSSRAASIYACKLSQSLLRKFGNLFAMLFKVFPKHSLQLYSLKNKKLLLQAKINARFA